MNEASIVIVLDDGIVVEVLVRTGFSTDLPNINVDVIDITEGVVEEDFRSEYDRYEQVVQNPKYLIVL